MALIASGALLAQDGGSADEGARADAAASAADGAVAAAAAAEDIDRRPVRCIQITRLDRTEVVDDETVLFFMRGGDIYRNRLSPSCPGLEREKRFTYRIQGSQLCRVDTITVLESRAFSLTDGFTCALGNFSPISEGEAEQLTAPVAWAGEVEVEAVELPEESASAGDPAAAPDGAEAER